MSRPYVPGIWAKKYEQLPPPRKSEVNAAVNQLFKKETEVSKKLDPKRDIELVRRWLRIRDALMEWLALGKTLRSALQPNALELQALSSVGHFALDVDGGVDSLAGTPKVSVQKTEIEFSVGSGISQNLFDWIRDLIQGRRSRKQVVLLQTDDALRVVSALSFENVALDRVAFPTVDATSKDAAQVTLLAATRQPARPEHNQLAKFTAAPNNTKAWLAANFRLEIGGLNTSRVVKVEPVAFGAHGSSDLVVTFPETELAPFTVERSGSRVTQGTLAYLSQDLSDAIFTLSFGRLTPVGEPKLIPGGLFKARFSVAGASFQQ